MSDFQKLKTELAAAPPPDRESCWAMLALSVPSDIWQLSHATLEQVVALTEHAGASSPAASFG